MEDDDRTPRTISTGRHDYPRERRILRHYLSVALLPPSEADGKPSNDKTAKEPAKNGNGKPSSSSAPGSRPRLVLPKSWADIDVNCVVLAKDDGPARSWWEVVVTDRHNGDCKLRWRDYPALAEVTRPRSALALLYPKD